MRLCRSRCSKNFKKSRKNLSQSQKALEPPLPTQSSQASFRESGRPYEAERSNSRQPSLIKRQFPWCDQRTNQQSFRQITQVENVASEAEVTEVTWLLWMERLEACLSTVMQDQNNAAEAARERQTKMDQRLAQVQRLNDRIALKIGTMISQKKRVTKRLNDS